ncbi:transmembrane protein 116 isoform X2 [Oncorhynchus tshawytscha]|uniref:transmembrane protein 116 isoform X2 n=1 Tax=Oncorhynchus tshawytscha TaxID=74940 RepID=UPI000D098001|nr:transmembrane protein 116 isoform X2 [Oncorhynchus tshawytscha]
MLNFVLQDVSNNTEQNTTTPEDWTVVYFAVRWIQMTMAVLSIVGSGSIIVYATFQHLIRTPETPKQWPIPPPLQIQPLFLLSVTDLLLAVSWLVGAVLFTQDCESHATCYNLHIVEQILYMTSFFYTLNYVWTLYSGLNNRFYSSLHGYPAQCATKLRSFSKIAAVLSCVLPVLLMLPVFVTGNMDHCYTNFSQPYKCLLMHTEALFMSTDLSKMEVDSACRLGHMYSIAVFLAVFLLTFVGIVVSQPIPWLPAYSYFIQTLASHVFCLHQVLMGKARTVYRRCVSSSGFLGDRQWASLRVLDRHMLLYPSVFFFCWGPVFLAAMILYNPKSVEGVVGVILYILQVKLPAALKPTSKTCATSVQGLTSTSSSQAFTSSSQGLLNCVVYGWTQTHFRSASKDALRDMDTQTPLLRSQKKGYKTLWSTPSPKPDDIEGSGVLPTPH